MIILVTGVCGQLGYDVMCELLRRNITTIGSDILEEYATDDKVVSSNNYVAMDITNKNAVDTIISDVKPDAVIHCAAWTAVDAAEDEENISKVHQVNAVGTENIAKACASIGAKMMYISTDYVFDGQGEEPWKADDTNYAPLNIYGQSKLDGEKAVASNLSEYFIVRIAWVFGKNGKNFIKTMLNVAKSHDTLTVVSDQIGTPTYTFDLARLLVDMIQTDKYGFYHATNEGGFISWYDFTKEIFKQATLMGREEYSENRVTVKPVTTEEYGVSKAARPFNSRLDKSKLVEKGFEPLPDWKDAVARYLREIEF